MSTSDTIQPRLLVVDRPVRLDTLVRLRWLAVFGQLAGVLFVEFGLGYPVHLAECLAVIGLSAAFNLWLMIRHGGTERATVRSAVWQLAYDSLQLAGLLALTGGLQNPFAILLLAPVSVAATSLSQRATVAIAALAIILASVVSIVHFPLPWDPLNRIVFDRVYIIGIWVSIVCGVVFVAAYTNRVAREGRQLAQALAATELALSRHEQLHALDGLAAAAAHELGTPLSTIALAAKEMRSEVPPGPLADDIELIISQSARCRAILAKLRNLGAEGGDPFESVPLADLLAETADPHTGESKQIVVEREAGTVGPDPILRRSVGLLYGLGNLIENAADFARSRVTVRAGWDRQTVRVTIIDDGPGFPVELMSRLGEPYLTTRTRGDASTPGGLGLGIFIAKTLLERTGAQLTFDNATASGHARVTITWPRDRIELPATGRPVEEMVS